MKKSHDNVYLELTEKFNQGKTRAIISSGQAVVLHRLAIMSKDGDWIVLENQDDLEFILNVLEKHHAVYRFGAPLDVRWLAGGWSSHFEFMRNGIRVRCDFFSRPPRLSDQELSNIWMCQSQEKMPFLDVESLIKVKLTQREKDYAVIGELARKQPPEQQLLSSRSAKDLIVLAATYPELVKSFVTERPLLGLAWEGTREALEEALDKERREFMRADERRLDAYAEASVDWRSAWPSLQRSIVNAPLIKAHDKILQHAQNLLPYAP